MDISVCVLKPFGDGIWVADGPVLVAALGFAYPTRMAAIRLANGDVFVWSPVKLTSELVDAIKALGPVAHVVAPNALHHVFLTEWQAAYPAARFYAAPGLRQKRRDVAFHGDLTGAPETAWAGQIDQVLVAGNIITNEVVFFHHQSQTAIFTDLLQQFPARWFSGWRSVVAKLDLMTGAVPAVPRKFRVAFTDRALARAACQTILSWPSQHVLMAHGTPVVQGGQEALRKAFAWLVPG
ncbi:MAG: DUF4336 domain-containing protein [Beijerinckiaceae bacterium]